MRTYLEDHKYNCNTLREDMTTSQFRIKLVDATYKSSLETIFGVDLRSKANTLIDIISETSESRIKSHKKLHQTRLIYSCLDKITKK